jgi:hypothetical protein
VLIRKILAPNKSMGTDVSFADCARSENAVQLRSSVYESSDKTSEKGGKNGSLY